MPGYTHTHPPYSAKSTAARNYHKLAQPIKSSRTRNSPQHHPGIRQHIRQPHPKRRPRHARHDILHDEHSDTASHAARKERKAKEQHNTRLPRDAGPGVREGVGGEARLLDRVDDQHAQRGEDEGQPVDEGDVGVEGAVEGGLGVDGCVEEDVEGEGELGVVS